MAALGGSCLGVHVAFVRRARWLSVALKLLRYESCAARRARSRWTVRSENDYPASATVAMRGMAREDRAVRLAWCKTLAIEQHEQKTL